MKTTPEQQLWDYVLRQAIADLTYTDPFHPHEQHTIRQDTRAWFMKDKNEAPRVIYDERCRRNFEHSDWDGTGCDPDTGTFEWICGVLGLKPNEIREMVLDDDARGPIKQPAHQVR